MSDSSPDRSTLSERVHAETLDSFDEELEMELDDGRMDRLLDDITQDVDEHRPEGIDRRLYFRELFRLQGELVRLQDWVVHRKDRKSVV